MEPTTTHLPATEATGLTDGVVTMASLELNDIRGVSGIFSVDDGQRRQLDIVANSTEGSVVTLGAWDAKAGEVRPVVSVGSTGVVVAQPLTAPTLSATTVEANVLTDGLATLSNATLTGLKTLTLSESLDAHDVQTQSLVFGEAGAPGSFRMSVATDMKLVLEKWDTKTGSYKHIQTFK